MLFFGLVDLSVPLFFQSRPEFYEGYLIETGWGVLFTFFVGLPLCFLGAQPRWISAAVLSGTSGVAVLIASVASGQPVHLIIAAALLVPSGSSSSARSGAAEAPTTRQLKRAVRGDGELGQAGAAARTRADLLPPAIGFRLSDGCSATQGRARAGLHLCLRSLPCAGGIRSRDPAGDRIVGPASRGLATGGLLVAAGTAWFGVVSIVYPEPRLGAWAQYGGGPPSHGQWR